MPVPTYDQFFMQALLERESGWAQAVYLAGMFAVVLWRKQSVVKWRLYRISYLLYAFVADTAPDNDAPRGNFDVDWLGPVAILIC